LPTRYRARELLRALIPLQVKWVGQAGIGAAFDDELLALLAESGCQGLLIGLESLDPDTLAAMGKGFVTPLGSYEAALANLRRHRHPPLRDLCLRLRQRYGGNRGGGRGLCPAPPLLPGRLQPPDPFSRHAPLPAPGAGGSPPPSTAGGWTPAYRYGMLPFAPEGISAAELEEACIGARRRFFRLGSIVRRSLDFRSNSSSLFMGGNFFVINALMRREVLQRRQYPLGDESVAGELLEVAEDGR
jgi:hypothetical protein